MKKEVFFCYSYAFIFWLLPFIARISMGDIAYEQNDTTAQENTMETTVVDDIIQSFNDDNFCAAFGLIFKNNIKSCCINIAGGVMLGLGTIVNLAMNGFFSSDIFVSSYYSGMSIDQILAVTLPHSFELIGFWLSGAIGLWIAWNMIQFIRGKESFTRLFYKRVGLWSVLTFVIILAAAFVEAYISSRNAL